MNKLHLFQIFLWFILKKIDEIQFLISNWKQQKIFFWIQRYNSIQYMQAD